VPPAGRITHTHTTVRERGAGRSTRGHADEERGKEEVCCRPAAALQMMARSEAWAGALATPAGGGRDLEKAGERERERNSVSYRRGYRRRVVVNRVSFQTNIGDGD